MEFNELIEERRSIRAFDGSKTVTKEQVLRLIDAAIQAPSWKNSQTARYYCVMSPEMSERLSAECLPEFNRNSSKGAVYVVTSFVEKRAGFDREGNPDNECGNGWGYYDLGLHNENFVLAAKNEGLDTLIMGIRDAKKIRAMLNVSENEIIVAVIALGYRANEPQKPKRKLPEEITKFY